MSVLEATRAHYAGLQMEASRVAAQTLRDLYGLDVSILSWTGRAAQALVDQWGGSPSGWDWVEIRRRYREPKSFCFSIWSPQERLVGLALITMTGAAATLRYVEGDPDAGCLYRGKRALIALEVAANYAQGAGLAELRIQPLNQALATLYQDVYGFALVTPRKEAPYYAKRI